MDALGDERLFYATAEGLVARFPYHPDAIALARRIFQESPRFLGEGVFELEYRPDVGVTAVFENGMRVTFGDERAYEYKIAVLANLLDQLAATRYTPRAVDLRFGERVTYE